MFSFEMMSWVKIIEKFSVKLEPFDNQINHKFKTNTNKLYIKKKKIDSCENGTK